MAHLRGVEVGKILRTEADVIEHSYPQLFERYQGKQTGVFVPPPHMPAPKPVTPVTPNTIVVPSPVIPVIPAQPTPQDLPPANTPLPKKASSSKKDKAKAKLAEMEDAPSEDPIVQMEEESAGFVESDS
jgi:hypothetical protein